MNSYAIYRIAETLRVLLFMTAAICVFNFFPLTAIMIVMLALLNDGAILSIAYDNVLYRNKPEAWNMRTVLGVATVLGLVGPCAAFGLFYLADKVFHIKRPEIQTMMYLMLSVAGHLTIFQTRTRGPWWSIRPAWILLAAVFGTQTFATLICVFGILVTPLWWGWAALVWGYAIAWFLITDPVKLLAYRVLDHFKTETKVKTHTAEKPDAEADASAPADKVDPKKPDAKPDATSAAAVGSKAEPKAASKSDAEPKAEADAASKPAAPSPDPAPKTDPQKSDAKPDATAPVAPDAKAGPNADPKSDAEPKAEADAASKPAAPSPDPAPSPDAKAAPEPGPKGDPAPKAEAGAKPEGKAAGASALDMTLGELLLAGMVKDPEDAGRIIAAAIALTPPSSPAAGAMDQKPQAGSGAKAETPSTAAPKAAA
jgi:H+-transporting ATPase